MTMHTSSKSALATVSVAGLVALSACGTSGSSEAEAETTEIQVFAAASLNAAGADLEKAFEEANPNVDIVFNYAGSSKLVQQMEQGATPDLLITADTKTMKTGQESVKELEQAEITTVATNQLVLATSAGNPAHIDSVSSLASADVTTAICAAEVPCGNLAHQELENQGVTLGNATEEENVSQVATKVSTGAVDAGFIYSTDAAVIKKEQDITEIALDDLEKNSYPMALTSTGQDKEAARTFADWLNSEDAQKILADYGFGAGE